jgi:hypothetical protein
LITCKDTAKMLLSYADVTSRNPRRKKQREKHSLTATI